MAEGTCSVLKLQRCPCKSVYACSDHSIKQLYIMLERYTWVPASLKKKGSLSAILYIYCNYTRAIKYEGNWIGHIENIGWEMVKWLLPSSDDVQYLSFCIHFVPINVFVHSFIRSLILNIDVITAVCIYDLETAPEQGFAHC